MLRNWLSGLWDIVKLIYRTLGTSNVVLGTPLMLRLTAKDSDLLENDLV
jgi:hypothetical protein